MLGCEREAVSVQPTDGIGVEFLDYRIEAVVGQGGMGIVYRAYDVRLKRTVALKLMAPALALDEGFQDRFSRESELAMALEHPNVVPIYDAGEVDGRLYLAMRYVEGTDLRRQLREEGTLAPGEAVAIVKQVAHALDAAHAKGLVHRDVKPSNVLLDAGSHVYLADFGLTRRFAEEGFTFGDGRSLGTPAYLAPEQIEGGPVDGRADVYSLGCMLYECLTGTAPFSRGSRLAMVWAHLEEEPPSASEHNTGLPEAIDDVIRKALAKDPQDRYQTCAELVAGAEEALDLRETSTSLRRTLALVAGVMVLGLAAVVAILVARSADEPEALAAPTVRKNTLVRVNPATNAIEAVVDVGNGPLATAVAGGRVWVYHGLGDTVSEIDPATNSVRHTTPVSSEPADTSVLAGPFFAADEGGAWVVGDIGPSDSVLTRVLPDGKGTLNYHLKERAYAVAVDAGAVWVLTIGDGRSHVLRVDAATGAVTRRLSVDVSPAHRRLSVEVSPAEGMAVSNGAAWIMDQDTARLFRVDLRTGATRDRDFGEVATPPVVGFGSIWICAASPGSSMIGLDPRTFRVNFFTNSIPAEQGRFAVGFGSLWRHDVPSGNVIRFDPETGEVATTIRVSPEPPSYGSGVAPTAVATGAGSVWITVA
jgi:Protein kinase domain/PQQ-like domain